MPRLGIDRDFLWEFGKLDRTVQQRVYDAFAKFEQATHAGAHLEKIGNVRDERLRSIRIDQFWRGIVLAPESGDSYTLLKVLPHDDAYAWARRRQFSVNRATGTAGDTTLSADAALVFEVSNGVVTAVTVHQQHQEEWDEFFV